MVDKDLITTEYFGRDFHFSQVIIVFTWTIDCKLRSKSGGLCIYFSDVPVVELSHKMFDRPFSFFFFLKFPAGFSGKIITQYGVRSTE